MSVEELCKKTASCLADVNKYKSLQPIVWEPTTLSHGYPGPILAFSRMDELFPNEGWMQVCREHVILLVEEIQTRGMRDTSLFAGLTGIILSLQSYAKNHAGTWQPLCYLKQIQEDKVLSIIEHDVVSGIAGIIPYIEKPIAEKLLQKLIREHRESHDTGIAHGRGGILTALSCAKLSRITTDGQEELIREIVRWLQEIFLQYNNFPSLIVDSTTLFYRDGWCYGAPGIAHSLLLAAHALQEESIFAFAREVLDAVCLRWQMKQNNISCPSFCHGVAGMLAVLGEFQKYNPSILYQKTIEEIIDLLSSKFDPTLPFGFACEVNLPGNIAPAVVDCPGLLNGSSGIALSLLNLLNNKGQPYAFCII